MLLNILIYLSKYPSIHQQYVCIDPLMPSPQLMSGLIELREMDASNNELVTLTDQTFQHQQRYLPSVYISTTLQHKQKYLSVSLLVYKGSRSWCPLTDQLKEEVSILTMNPIICRLSYLFSI